MVDLLRKKLGNDVKENEVLAPYTTYKIGGPAKYFFNAKNNEELVKSIKAATELSLDYFLLGGGSNILISDDGFDGLVIRKSNDNFKIENERIIAESGAELGKVLEESLKAGLVGWPWAAGIPGTIGGAVRGNAGAYGKGMADITESVEVYEDGEVKKYTNEQMGFDYRHSIIKDKKDAVVVSVELKLKKGSMEEIKKDKEIITQYLERRKTTQPTDFPNSGCVFKNIDLTKVEIDKEKVMKGLDINEEEFHEATKFGKLPVSYITDKLGLKGKKIGGAQISEKHGAFINNVDNARAEEVVMLISDIKMHVRNELGIQLQEEVQYVGF